MKGTITLTIDGVKNKYAVNASNDIDDVSLEGVVCLLDTFMQMFDLDAMQTALLAHVAAENRKQGGKRSYEVDCSKFAEAAEKTKGEGEQHDDTM